MVFLYTIKKNKRKRISLSLSLYIYIYIYIFLNIWIYRYTTKSHNRYWWSHYIYKHSWAVCQKAGLVKTLDFVNPEMRKTLGFHFQKESQLKFEVSYHGNWLCEPNLLAGRFSSTNPEFHIKAHSLVEVYCMSESKSYWHTTHALISLRLLN